MVKATGTNMGNTTLHTLRNGSAFFGSAVASVLLVCSCSTPYQPKGARGGYWEGGDRDGYVVHFGGNEMTSREAIIAGVVRRAKELCPLGYEEFKQPEYQEKRGGDEAIMYVRCPKDSDTDSSTRDAPKDGAPSACVPGSQVECACGRGKKGFQICNDAGSKFDKCHCD